MKRAILVWLLASLAIFERATNAAASEGLTDLSQLQWQYRILVVGSATPEKSFTQLMDSYGEELKERQVVVFVLNEVVNEVVNEASQKSNYSGAVSEQLYSKLLTRYSLSNRAFVLIGKDGLIKLQGNQLEPSNVFSVIDQMPMRIQEMRAKQGKKEGATKP